MVESFSLYNIAQTIKRQYKFCLLVVILVPTISISASFLMDNLYKSTVVIFPSNSYLNDRNYYYNNAIQSLYSQFGTDDDVDIINEVGSLYNIDELIVDSLQLVSKYQINNTNLGKARSKATNLLRKRIRFIRTKNNAVEISVWDTDAVQSAKILEVLLYFMNNHINHLYHQKTENELAIISYRITSIKQQLLKTNIDTSYSKEINDISKDALVKQLSEAEKIKLSMIDVPWSNKTFYQVNKVFTYYNIDKPKRIIIGIFSLLAAVVIAVICAVIIDAAKLNKKNSETVEHSI